MIADRRTASMEDYLEAIVMIAEEGKPINVTEISKVLGVKKPSVTAAMAKFAKAGLVVHERYGDVALTAEGAKVGQDVYRRHETLRHFLIDILNVAPETARKDACGMEHSLSRASLERLTKFLEFVLNCPRGKPEWLDGLNYYFEHGKRDAGLLARCQRDDA